MRLKLILQRFLSEQADLVDGAPRLWRHGILPCEMTERLYRIDCVILLLPVYPAYRIGSQWSMARLGEAVHYHLVIAECQVRLPELRQLDLCGEEALLGLTFLTLALPGTFLQLEEPFETARSLQRYSGELGAGRFVGNPCRHSRLLCPAGSQVSYSS